MNLTEFEKIAPRGPRFHWDAGRSFGIMLAAGTVLLGGLQAARGQAAPQYQSPVNAPVPQYTLPKTTPITPNGEVVEDVIARVNDQIIDRSDLARAAQQLEQEGQQSGASAADIADGEKNLLRDLVDKQLMLSRGKELGINADAEVVRRLDEIRKQNKMDSLDDLQKAVEQQGISYEDFKAQIRNTVVSQEVVRDEVGRHLQMTQAQETAYYDAHKQDFEQPEQIRLSEILVPVAADASETTVAQAQEKANGIVRQLKNGDLFETLAKQVSGGPTAAEGGDLGMFKRGALGSKVLEDPTFALKAGQNTEPIRTRQGFVILKVTQHDEAGVPPLKSVEPQVQEAMYTAQIQPALRTYLTKLREDAYIDIKPGFVDTGASPKQSKPVNTAYSAPVSKKLSKEAKKARFNRGRAPLPAVQAKPAVIKLDKNGKPKKVKREKIRYGQAPEQSLPPGAARASTGADAGVGAAQAAGAGATLAPGTAIAPVDASTINENSDADALAQKPAKTGKTRFADKTVEVKAAKVKKVNAKVADKKIATPVAMTDEEKRAAQLQAAPLGLNGDTGKKKKKKRVKGDAKQRLKEKPKDPNATPERNPDGSYPTPYHAPSSGAPAAPAPGTTTPPPASGTPPAAPTPTPDTPKPPSN